MKIFIVKERITNDKNYVCKCISATHSEIILQKLI